MEVERVGGGRDAGGVDGLQPLEVVEDVGELVAELVDVGVGEAETGEVCDVADFFGGEGHMGIMPDGGMEREGAPIEEALDRHRSGRNPGRMGAIRGR